MSEIKPPAVAGRFYPGEPASLLAQVEHHVTSARAPKVAIKAMIAPHAGYVYSGPVAGTGYNAVKSLAERVRRVVLLGPAHRVRVEGLAAPSSAALATPLGAVPIDREALARAVALPGVEIDDAAFAEEHSLEVHLPFLQHAFRDFAVVPLLVGGASAEAVEHALAALWGGPETLVVISSDLSHYQPYDEARAMDRQTVSRIEALDPSKLDGYQACGCRAVAGLLRMAQRLDLRATTLDLRNSGDTAGDKRRVVGYSTVAFEYASEARLSEDARKALIETARRTIEFGVRNKRRPTLNTTRAPLPLHAMRRSFVTVTIDGKLRGCIGAAGLTPLAESVATSAYGAAFDDPRFEPLTPEELKAIEIDVSILSHPRPIAFRNEAELFAALQPDVDGLIIEAEGRRGLFLPSVWEKLPEPKDFLGRLKQKAGLAPDYWSPNLRAWRYRTESFGSGDLVS